MSRRSSSATAFGNLDSPPSSAPDTDRTAVVAVAAVAVGSPRVLGFCEFFGQNGQTEPGNLGFFVLEIQFGVGGGEFGIWRFDLVWTERER